MNNNNKQSTAYVVRDPSRRQYFNLDSPRNGRWGRLDEASLYFNKWDATRQSLYINMKSPKDRATVVPIPIQSQQ